MVKSIERVLTGETLRKAFNKENISLVVDGLNQGFYFKSTVGAYVSYSEKIVLRWTAGQDTKAMFQEILAKKVCYL